MALINKIREKTGLVVGLIAFGLILFMVGSDILGPSSVLFGEDQNVGEIAGYNVSREEYDKIVMEIKQDFDNRGTPPSEALNNFIYDQAWEKLIGQIAFEEEYDKLGLAISESEIIDIVQGNNIDPQVVQIVQQVTGTDSVGGVQVRDFLSNVVNPNPEYSAFWSSFEKTLVEQRLRTKYDNLLNLSNYVTTAEAKRNYEEQETKVDIKYLYVPFSSINDSTIKVTDEQLADYLNENKYKYQEKEESRSAAYVSFSIIPSSKDSTLFFDEFEEVRTAFSSAQNDSIFAAGETDGSNSFAAIEYDNLPFKLKEYDTLIQKGAIMGPYQENGMYKLSKISDIYEEPAYRVKASHILIKAGGANVEQAKEKAQGILEQLKTGANFEILARIHSEDPGSAVNGGDLGWFERGKMVTSFENAAFGATKAGLIDTLVQSQFGFHIINVTQPKEATKINKMYKVATVERELFASEETTDSILIAAEEFADSIEDWEDLKKTVENDSLLSLNEAEDITKMARNINTIANAREIVRWLYKDASLEEVSKVFDVENAYVIAALTGIQEKGTANLDRVRDELTTQVRNQKKAEKIKDKLKKQQGSIDKMANSYGSEAQVYTQNGLQFTSASLQNVNQASKAVAKSFGLEKGKMTKPFADENGVFVVSLLEKTQAPEIADYNTYKTQIQQGAQRNASFKISNAIKHFSDIEDERYKFY